MYSLAIYGVDLQDPDLFSVQQMCEWGRFGVQTCMNCMEQAYAGSNASLDHATHAEAYHASCGQPKADICVNVVIRST